MTSANQPEATLRKTDGRDPLRLHGQMMSALSPGRLASRTDEARGLDLLAQPALHSSRRLPVNGDRAFGSIRRYSGKRGRA